jgi:hypothetical protein
MVLKRGVWRSVVRHGLYQGFAQQRVLPVMASNDQSDDRHNSTYAGFTGAVKWGTIVVVSIVLGLYVFLV